MEINSADKMLWGMGTERVPQTDGAGNLEEGPSFPSSVPASAVKAARAAEEESLFESWLKDPSPSPREHLTKLLPSERGTSASGTRSKVNMQL